MADDPTKAPTSARPMTNRRRHAWKFARRVGLVAVAAAVLAGLSTPRASRPTGTSGSDGTAQRRPVDMALVAYRDCSDLLSSLRAHTAAGVGPFGLLGSFGYSGPALPAAGTPAGAEKAAAQPAPDHSTTNVQEIGVDEPDLVKTDGTRIVTVAGGVLRVVDAVTRKITGTLTVSSDRWTPSELLVSGDRALVLVHSDSRRGYAVPAVAGPLPIPPNLDGATYLLVDLFGAPRVLGSITPQGGYVDARMVGSTVRLVVRTSPNIAFPSAYPDRSALTDAQRTAGNRAIVRAAPLRTWLPTYGVTVGGVTTTRTVPCEQVSHPPTYTGTSMLTIYTIDLARGLRDVAPVSLAADGDTVYGTQSSLYIASSPTPWTTCCIEAMPAREAPAAPRQPAESTQIHRFDITQPGAPRYLGSGTVPGRVLSPYSLSDHHGYLRIATTTGDSQNASSSVYVVNADTLAVTGHVGGLGKGGLIYAVRFAGPLGYVVTFRQVDPLYVLDLHDPAAPRAAGELHITGYSSYLYPIGDGRLVGVGQEASSRGIVAGLQVSLFDVSNPASPKRLAQVVRTDAPGEGQLDPHAFLYWPDTGTVVVPVQSWSGALSGRVLVLKATGSALTTTGMVSHPARQQPNQPYPYGGIERSMVVDGRLWTLSDGGLKVSDLATLADQAWIQFD